MTVNKKGHSVSGMTISFVFSEVLSPLTQSQREAAVHFVWSLSYFVVSVWSLSYLYGPCLICVVLVLYVWSLSYLCGSSLTLCGPCLTLCGLCLTLWGLCLTLCGPCLTLVVLVRCDRSSCSHPHTQFNLMLRYISVNTSEVELLNTQRPHVDCINT